MNVDVKKVVPDPVANSAERRDGSVKIIDMYERPHVIFSEDEVKQFMMQTNKVIGQLSERMNELQRQMQEMIDKFCP